MTISPLTSNSALRRFASAMSIPCRAIVRLISSAIPVAAEPPPRKSSRCSVIFAPVMRSAARMPASATPAVPWMSSL